MAAIYLVTTPSEQRLVKAEQKTSAINHVIRGTIKARPLTAEEVVDFMQKEFEVEDATTKAPTPLTAAPEPAQIVEA